MADSYLVVGLGTFGSRVARALYEEGGTVLAVDQDENRVNAIRESCSKAICCDATDAEAMKAVGAFEVDTAIVAIRHAFGSTVLVTYSLHQAGIRTILVQVDNEPEASAIRAVGATEVIFPPRDMALRIAKRLIHPDLAESIPLGADMAMIDIPCPAPFVNRSLAELGLRTHYGVNLVGLRHSGDENTGRQKFSINPGPHTRLQARDNLLLLGNPRQLARIKALRDQDDGLKPPPAPAP
ncbi:MAG: TrkA family potassium uptake protein [Magnetococcales bacterium]|nr:TrkA family potassium uptake protein [Magnetococcales bacterium]